MRVLVIARCPHEPFNAAIKDGSIGAKMKAILDETKPEAAYFTEMNGLRTVVLAVELKTASMMPALAEPWFQTFSANVEFHPYMTAADIEQAGLAKLGEKWG